MQHGAELDCIAPRLGAPLHLAAKKNHAVHWLAPANRDYLYRLLRLFFVPAYYDCSCRLLRLFVPFAVQVMAEFLLSVGSDANLLWEGESALLIAARYRSQRAAPKRCVPEWELARGWYSHVIRSHVGCVRQCVRGACSCAPSAQRASTMVRVGPVGLAVCGHYRQPQATRTVHAMGHVEGHVPR